MDNNNNNNTKTAISGGVKSTVVEVSGKIDYNKNQLLKVDKDNTIILTDGTVKNLDRLLVGGTVVFCTPNMSYKIGDYIEWRMGSLSKFEGVITLKSE